jgi:hypothetical protein
MSRSVIFSSTHRLQNYLSIGPHDGIIGFVLSKMILVGGRLVVRKASSSGAVMLVAN